MRSRFRQVRWISLPNCAKRMKAITAAAATNGIVAHKGYQGARMRGIWGNLRMLRRPERFPLGQLDSGTEAMTSQKSMSERFPPGQLEKNPGNGHTRCATLADVAGSRFLR